MSNSIFAGISDAKARTDANYERPGNYIELIRRVKADRSRKGEDFVAIEKTVLAVLDDDEGRGHRVGDEVTHMLMAKHDSFLGNIKAMISAVFNVPTDQVSESDAVEVCADNQPMSGAVVECANRNQVTRRGTDFTIINYKRSLTVAEIRQRLDPAVLARYFPGDVLDRMEAAEQED
jgi:hypothetical protein